MVLGTTSGGEVTGSVLLPSMPSGVIVDFARNRGLSLRRFKGILKRMRHKNAKLILSKILDVVEPLNDVEIKCAVEVKHKYIRREGSPGDYTYVYKETEGREKKPEEESKEKQVKVSDEDERQVKQMIEENPYEAKETLERMKDNPRFKEVSEKYLSELNKNYTNHNIIKKEIGEESFKFLIADTNFDNERLTITKGGEKIYDNIGEKKAVTFPSDIPKWNWNSDLILTHTHPGSAPFSGGDITVFLSYDNIKKGVVYCKSGEGYVVEKTKDTKKISDSESFLKDAETKLFSVIDAKSEEFGYFDAKSEVEEKRILRRLQVEACKTLCKDNNLIFKEFKWK